MILDKIIRYAKKEIVNYPTLYLLSHLLRSRIPPLKFNLQELHFKFKKNVAFTKALDLGCGLSPSNLFCATTVYGLDLYDEPENNVLCVKLGFERIPYDDETFDYVTAYDLIEHIPRFTEFKLPNDGCNPFVYLMNEIFRVLIPGGVFISKTPVFPYLAAFQDPTHVNFITVDTFIKYFSSGQLEIAPHYGITCRFDVLAQYIHGQHLIAVLQKPIKQSVSEQ